MSESGLCVVLIIEYSVGSAVISRVVESRVIGFCAELFAGKEVTDCDRVGVTDFTVVRTVRMDCTDGEKAYTVLSPVATTSEPSAFIAI